MSLVVHCDITAVYNVLWRQTSKSHETQLSYKQSILLSYNARLDTICTSIRRGNLVTANTYKKVSAASVPYCVPLHFAVTHTVHSKEKLTIISCCVWPFLKKKYAQNFMELLFHPNPLIYHNRKTKCTITKQIMTACNLKPLSISYGTYHHKYITFQL